MNYLIKPALVAGLLVVISGCRGFSPPASPDSLTVELATVTSVTPAADGTAAVIVGSGSYSITSGAVNPGGPLYLVSAGNAGSSGSSTNSDGSTTSSAPASQLNVTFDPSIDSSDCVNKAQQALTSGSQLQIDGSGTVTSTGTIPPIACPPGEACLEPGISSVQTITFTAISSCTLETGSGSSSSGSGNVTFSTHFSSVTSANPGIQCPDGQQCLVPALCLAGAPNCGVDYSPTIGGTATTTYANPISAGSQLVSNVTIGPSSTTLTYPSSLDGSNLDCVKIAEQAKADGRGLTVTGTGTVEPDTTGCAPIPYGSNISCPENTQAYINATRITTCVEDTQ